MLDWINMAPYIYVRTRTESYVHENVLLVLTYTRNSLGS